MRNHDSHHSSVLTFPAMTTEWNHASDLVIEAYDQWSDERVADVVAFSAYTSRDDASWRRVAA